MRESPEQYRATLRARVRDIVRGSLERCDANARSIWAATIGVSHQLLDRGIARDGDKAIHFADMLAAPEPVRMAGAQELIGEGYCIASVPEAVETPDDLALLARLVRESNAAVEALMSAIADGRISADEGAKIVDACQRSLAVTATVRQLGERAVKARLLGVRLRSVSP